MHCSSSTASVAHCQDDCCAAANDVATCKDGWDVGLHTLVHDDSIANYAEVYKLVKQLQEDIYTDVMYPNDLRPKENHGYKSRYKG